MHNAHYVHYIHLNCFVLTFGGNRRVLPPPPPQPPPSFASSSPSAAFAPNAKLNSNEQHTHTHKHTQLKTSYNLYSEYYIGKPHVFISLAARPNALSHTYLYSAHFKQASVCVRMPGICVCLSSLTYVYMRLDATISPGYLVNIRKSCIVHNLYK